MVVALSIDRQMKPRAGYENGEDQLQQTDTKSLRKDKNLSYIVVG